MLLLVAQTNCLNCFSHDYNLGATFFECNCVPFPVGPARAQTIKKDETQYILKLYLVYSEATYISPNGLISAPPLSSHKNLSWQQ